MVSRRHLLCAGALAPFAYPAFGEEQFTEGKEYLLVNPAITSNSEKIEVVEFFAYSCPHCFHFQSIFDEWAKQAPNDVSVVYCPVSWIPQQVPLTKTFFTLDAMGLRSTVSLAFFESMINQTHYYEFETLEDDILSFMVEQGIDPEKWKSVYNSFGVAARAASANQLWQNYQVDSTPMVGVGGRFLTAPHLVGSREKTADCINYLVDLCRKNK